MKAITTRFVRPTETAPARIRASAEGVRGVTVQFDGDLSQSGAHLQAARALADKYGWAGKLVGGGTGKGYVFCFVDSWIREE